MKPDEMDARMRAKEIFHALKVPEDRWIVLRVDGRAFHTVTESFKKPFDFKFHTTMIHGARDIIQDFNALYAYTESDEISVLLPKETSLFDREVEKLVSVSASIASGRISMELDKAISFDGRIWAGETKADVVDYFRWRQADAFRSAVNSAAYWALRAKGLDETKASKALHRKGVDFKMNILRENGIDFWSSPLWERYGSGIVWETFMKEGFNPKTGQTVPAERRKLKLNMDLPTGDEYGKFVLDILEKDLADST